uniref:Uncharacterized protein n=1 Tax=Trichogramma kaykai TaxID=54128 RepID=A0ABD2WDP3_9HYME
MLQDLQLTEEEYINAIRSTLKTKKIFYKRNSLEVAINPYNPTILKLLESNMGLQGVLDAYAAAFYMVNYVTKIEAGLSKLLKEASEDAEDGNLDLNQKLSKIANIFINGHVLSTQEAAYQILSLPLCYASKASVYINTVPKNERCRMLKTKKELKKLPKNSVDIYKSNIFQKYEKIPNQFDSYCLADYACKYTHFPNSTDSNDINEDNETNDNAATLTQRKKDKILRYHNYRIDTDMVNYYREQLLLFLPFRCEDTEIINKDYKEMFFKNYHTITTNKKNDYAIDETDRETALELAELNEDKDEDEDEKKITT